MVLAVSNREVRCLMTDLNLCREAGKLVVSAIERTFPRTDKLRPTVTRIQTNFASLLPQLLFASSGAMTRPGYPRNFCPAFLLLRTHSPRLVAACCLFVVLLFCSRFPFLFSFLTTIQTTRYSKPPPYAIATSSRLCRSSNRVSAEVHLP